MKRFLRQLFAFIAIIVLCLVAFWALICSNRDETLKLPPNTNIVFLGTSHIACAINDNVVKNSFNFARNAENMEFVYCKIKLLKKYNPRLDTIVVGFDNSLLIFNTSTPKLYSPYYYDTYNFRDLKTILTRGKYSYIESHFTQPFNWLKLFQVIESYFSPVVDARLLDEIGGYIYSNRDKLDEAIKRHTNRNNIQSNIKCDIIAEYFLNEIENYCKKNKITLLFMHTPMHKVVRNDGDLLYERYYKQKYSHIKFYDFREMYLPDSCFGDLDHLNYKGAKAFSEFLEKEVLHKQNYPIK